MGHYRFLLLLFCAVWLPRLASGQSDANEQIVPIKLYHGTVVVVKGTIGSLAKRNLVIDTGAYPSVVDEDVANKLGLPGVRSAMRVVSRTLPSRSVRLTSLEIGPIQVQGIRTVVQDLTQVSEQLGVRVDALVGLDVLANRNFRINYQKRTITFGTVNGLERSVPIHQISGLACIDMKIGGKPQRLLLDTGAANLVLFSERAAWVPRFSGNSQESVNLGGTVVLRQLKVDGLSLGDQSFPSQEILVSDTSNMSIYPFDGLLAPAGLHFSQIAFDFDRQTFSWETDGARSNRRTEPATASQPLVLRAMLPMIPGVARE